MDEMDLGEIIDLVITANNMMSDEEEVRQATQADWDAL